MMKSKAKTFIISFLALLFALCLGIALAACSGGDKKTSKDVYGAGEEGVYYYDADSGAEYTLTLQSGVYMITRGNLESYTGSYSYDEEEGTITFKANTGETFTADFADDAMSVAIGTSATFLKSINYTVTFVDGGKIVDEQSVRYGRAAEKVTGDDADRVFLGWYTDAAFTNEYKFDSAVTGDMTLYAWYIDIDHSAVNYVVTFVAADGTILGTAETVNGRVYEFPEVDGILGWWVSDTNEQSELTYRYDSDSNPENHPVLTENTKLFARIDASGVLGASVYGDEVTWTANASSVTIALDGETLTTSGARGYYEFDFSSLSTGAHEITVSAAGYGSETLVYVARRLDRVSTFEVYGNVLVYNAVENAEYYCVSVTCGNEAHDHEMVYNGKTLTYDFSSCEMGPDGITFTVYAYAAGYAGSVSDTFVYALILDGTEVSIDGASDTASWTAVASATGYEVYINGDCVGTVTGTEYSLKYYGKGASISVAVKPVAPGYYSEISAAKTYVKTTLKTPEITSITDYTISWEDVGASGYELNINGYLIYSGTATTYFLTESDMEKISDVNTNAVSVTAIGGTASENSQRSDLVYVTDKTMYPALSYSDGTVYWQYALSASGYYVEYEGTVTGPVYGNSFDVTFSHSGENVLRVYFEDDNGEKCLAEMTIYAYAVIFDVREKADTVDTIYVAAGDTIELPTPENVQGFYTFGGWYTLPTTADDPWADAYFGDGTLYADGEAFSKNATVILYAFWINDKSDVTYIVGTDGTLTDENGQTVSDVKVPLGVTDYTLGVPVNADAAYVFYGWFADAAGTGTRYTDENGKGLVAFTAEAGTTVYAVYKEAFKFNDTTYNNESVKEVKAGGDIALFKTLTVPAEYEGETVAVANSNAFKSTALEVLNLPDTMAYIQTANNGHSSGNGAFAGCDALKEVNIYETGEEPDIQKEVTYYSDDGVLYKLSSLSDYVELIYYPYAKTAKTFTLPDAVSNAYEYVMDENMNEVHVVRAVGSIATQVFNGNTNIQAVVLPATLENIDSKAFYGCTSLESVTTAENVKNKSVSKATKFALGSLAFQNCTALTEVSLPAYMTSFEIGAFTGCTAFERIDIVGTNGNYTSVDGYLCSADGATLVYCPRGRTGEVTIPAGVVTIGDSAFSTCTGITKVTIPSIVTKIGEAAFSGCTSLVTLIFEGTANDGDLSIATKAFYGCSALVGTDSQTGLVLPQNLTSLGSYAFGNCKALLTVTLNARQGTAADALDFASNVFTTSTSSATSYITTLNIGEYLPLIDINDVIGGATLATVTVAEGNQSYSVTEDGQTVMSYDEEELVFVSMAVTGAYSIPDTVEVVDAYVFQKRTTLTSVTVPVSVQSIGEGAFKNATALTSVTFSEPTETGASVQNLVIGKDAFYGCTVLSTVTLPARLVEIGDNAFYNCKALTSIEIPTGTVKMGAYDASGKLTSMTVFDGCSALTEIKVASGNTAYTAIEGVLYAADAAGNPVTLLVCPVKCGGATDTGTGYRTVTIPATVTTIWTKAFYNNSAVQYIAMGTADDGGDEASATEQKMEIGDAAFQSATALVGIDFPYGITSIPADSFKGDILLSSISIPNSVTSIASGAFSGCTSLSVIDFYGEGKEALVIEDGTASETGAGAFSGLNRLTKVTLPERTTKIGTAAFRGCSSLEYINIPEECVTIGQYAFYGCSSLANLDMPYNETTGEATSKLETIDSYAFQRSGVKELLHLPETLKTIGISAFAYSSVEKVIFPASLEVLGSYPTSSSSSQYYGAFSYASRLEEVTFEKGIKIEFLAGFESTNIKEIEIPASVQLIYSSTFYYCHNLEKVTFEAGSHCTELGTNMFYCCTGLKYVAFPDLADEVMNDPSFSGITLGANMFEGCSALEYVYISAGVTTIISTTNSSATLFGIQQKTAKTGDEVVFDFAEDSDYYYHDAENKVVYSALVDDNGKAILDENGHNQCGDTLYLAYGEIVGEFTIPDGVKEVSQLAFTFQTSMTKLNCPASLETISYYCFSYCTGLKEVTFGKNSRLSDTGTYAFRGCTSLETIELPEGLTSLGNYTFYECSSLESIELPSTLTSLGTYVFRESGLESITLPKGITTLSNYLFEGCASLTSVTFEGKVTSFGTYVFQDCTSLVSITIPDTVTSLGNYCFDGCSALTNVTIPSSVTSLGNYCFQNCTSLTSISIPDSVTSLGTYLFRYDSALTSVNLGSGASTLGNYTFYGCTALTQIVLPEKVTTLGTYLFAECENLTSVTINGNVTTITAEAFQNCGKLETLTLAYPTSVTTVNANAFDGCTSLKNLNNVSSSAYYDETTNIYDITSVTSIAANAFQNCGVENLYIGAVTTTNAQIFYGCTSLKSVTFVGATTLGKSAFGECTALTDINGLSDSMTITAGSATSAANLGAFGNCTALVEVNLNGMTSIPAYTFRGCTSLKKMASSADALATLSEGEFDLDGVTTIGNYAIYDCPVTVLYARDATSLGTYLLADNANVTAAYFDSATSLGNYEFQNCTSLGYVYAPNVTSYGTYCFSGCTALTEVDLSSVTSIGNYDFQNCTGLTYVDAQNATSIGTYAFYGCENLETVLLNDSLTSIGNYAFYGCSSLEDFLLPDALTSIGNYAFYGCTSLTTFTISKSVTSIGQAAFGASGITDIVVDEGNTTYKSVDGVVYTYDDLIFYYPSGREEEKVEIEVGTNVGAYAFYGNENVKEVILPDDITVIEDYAFYGATGLETIEIPAGVTSIGQYGFRDCSSLGTIVMHEGLETIGNYAFYCSGLGSVAIPYTVESIGNYCFCGNVSYTASVSNGVATVTTSKTTEAPLAEVTFGATDEVDADGNMVTTDAVITSLGQQAFAGTKITEIDIPASVTTLSSYLFIGCTDLTKVTINSNPASLGTYTFLGCTALETVNLPEGFTTLSNYMFAGCSSLKTIDLPDSITFLGQYTFICSGLESVKIPASVIHISSTEGVLPSSNTGSTYTFAFCESLEKVELNATLESIGYYVFAYDPSLTTITYTGYQEENSLSDEDVKGKAVFPGTLYQISHYGFYESGLVEITLPASLTTMYPYAFAYNTSLETVNLEDGIRALGTNLANYGFLGCTSLKYISFPEDMGYFGSYLFQGCTGFEKILLNSKVYVDGNVFNGWTAEEKIFIPVSQYHVEGPWSSNWNNNCEAQVFYYMEKPETTEGLADLGYTYWYYDENGTDEVEGRKITIWTYAGVTETGTTEYEDSTSGMKAVYSNSKETITGLYIDGKYQSAKAVSETNGTYYVTILGGDVYSVTLGTEAQTATISSFIKVYSFDAYGYISFEIDAATNGGFVGLYYYAGTIGDYNEYTVTYVTSISGTVTDDGSASTLTYYEVTIDGRPYYVTLNADGTATIAHKTVIVPVTIDELEELLDASIEEIMEAYGLEGTFGDFYIVYDETDDAIISVETDFTYKEKEAEAEEPGDGGTTGDADEQPGTDPAGEDEDDEPTEGTEHVSYEVVSEKITAVDENGDEETFYIVEVEGWLFKVTITEDANGEYEYTATAEYIPGTITDESGATIGFVMVGETEEGETTVTIYVVSDEAGVYWKHTLTENEKIEVAEAETGDEPEPDEKEEAEDEKDGKVEAGVVEPGCFAVTLGEKTYYFAIDKDANGVLCHITEEIEITLTGIDLSAIGTLYAVWDKTNDVIVEVGIKISVGSLETKMAMDVYYTDKVEASEGAEYYIVTVEDGYTFIGTISADETTGVYSASIAGILRQYTIGSDGGYVLVDVLTGEPMSIAIYDANEKKLTVTELDTSILEKVEVTDEDDGESVIDTYYKVTVGGKTYILTLSDKGTASLEHITEKVEVTYSGDYALEVEMDFTDDLVLGGTFTWTKEAKEGEEGEKMSYSFTAGCVKVEGEETYYLVTLDGTYTLRITGTNGSYTAAAAYVTYVVEAGYAYITVTLGETDALKGLYVYDSAAGEYVFYEVTYVDTTKETETDKDGKDVNVTKYYEVTIEGISYILTFSEDMTAEFSGKTGEIAVTLNDGTEFFLVYDYTADTFLGGAVYYTAEVEVEAEADGNETDDDDEQATEPQTETVTVRYEFSVICRKVAADDGTLQYYVTVNTQYGYILTLEDGDDGGLEITIIAGDDTATVQP